MASISGIEIYPMLSLVIFFAFFVILFWWVFTAKKQYIEQVSVLPLELEQEENPVLSNPKNQ